MTNFYEIIDISHVEADTFEALGTKSKFWYMEGEDKTFLFKSIETKGGLRPGEDWAEKIACELAELLGLPHAKYDLAIHQGVRGVVSPNFITMNRGDDLVHGNLLLQEEVAAADNPNVQYIDEVYSVMIHKIRHKPMQFNSYPDIKNASEFFTGYLMFDVLICNQDRHNENWGMVRSTTLGSHLAPSYDHGASLARNESDSVREERLTTNDVGRQIQTYAKRAKSQFKEQQTGTRLKLLEAFLQYGLKEKAAAKIWLERLEQQITEDGIFDIVSRIPENIMSDIAKRFTYQLLLVNRSNLLELKSYFVSE